MNYYEILEVSQTASQEIIKIAYKNLAKKHHPDIVGAEASVEKMKKINEAYDVLSNPLKRKEYDEFLHEEAAQAEDMYSSNEKVSEKDTRDIAAMVLQKFKSDFGTNVVSIGTTWFCYLKGWNTNWFIKIWYVFTIGWLCMFISEILSLIIQNKMVKKVISWLIFGAGIYIWYRITR